MTFIAHHYFYSSQVRCLSSTITNEDTKHSTKYYLQYIFMENAMPNRHAESFQLLATSRTAGACHLGGTIICQVRQIHHGTQLVRNGPYQSRVVTESLLKILQL